MLGEPTLQTMLIRIIGFKTNDNQNYHKNYVVKAIISRYKYYSDHMIIYY